MSEAKRRRRTEEMEIFEDSRGPTVGSRSRGYDVSAIDAQVTSALNGSVEGLLGVCTEAELIYAAAGKSFPYCIVFLFALACNSQWADARFLMQRCSENGRAPTEEVEDAFMVVRHFMRNDRGNALKVLESRVWPAEVEPVASKLVVVLRTEARELIERGYSSISVNKLSEMLGTTEPQARALVLEESSYYEPWKQSGGFLIPLTPSESTGRRLGINGNAKTMEGGSLEELKLLSENLLSLQFS
ncbi:hypothetical protein NDN08_002950 [Rhodosorus marinus]|uniref:CSN8/PSMD8/EIF3K domain-containing protein n=1 Tax=Rhodosorus marinus TaxID=101924 RepID=A0AAV8UZF9_9RHOD|nr:hypothetical protein NDN08_002950 [Rhodosorus marinus]